MFFGPLFIDFAAKPPLGITENPKKRVLGR